MSYVPSQNEIYIHSYLHLIGVSILYYDYFLTFSDEVSHIWHRPKSGASYLFLLNRYFTLLADIAVNVGNFIPFETIPSCKHYVFFRQVALIIAQVIVCLILVLRTYALYGRSKRVLTGLLLYGLVLVAASSWAMVGQHSEASIHLGCHLGMDLMTGIHTAVAWEALFCFDCAIIVLTMYKSWQERHRSNVAALHDLVGVIVRDGAIYFGVMACVNAANTVTFYVLSPGLRGVLSTFAGSMSVTLMSRVMLNLHSSAHSPSSPASSRGNRNNNHPTTTDDSTTLFFTSHMSMGPTSLGTMSQVNTSPTISTSVNDRDYSTSSPSPTFGTATTTTYRNSSTSVGSGSVGGKESILGSGGGSPWSSTSHPPSPWTPNHNSSTSSGALLPSIQESLEMHEMAQRPLFSSNFLQKSGSGEERTFGSSNNV